MPNNNQNNNEKSGIQDYDAYLKAFLKDTAALAAEKDSEHLSDYTKPLPEPRLKPAELAKQVAVVIREEFLADIAICGSCIRMRFRDGTFVLKVSKA